MQPACPQMVLIVDDDRHVAEALIEVLESEGYGVAVADNGKAALEQLNAGLRPCAIFLDLMMPVMDGWDFRHAQVSDTRLKDIPVVVVSAAGFSAETVRAQLGGVEYLAKPFQLGDFVTTVRRFCGGSHAAATAG
jgi:two-component system, chemotaxis family, chemotaxis protein CheY